MITKDSARKLYPHIDKGFVHLNHAGVSPLNTLEIDRMHAFNVRQSEDPVGTFPYMLEQWTQCRERLARLMGVPTSDLAFTKNTAQGLNIIADGLDWKPGDEVIFADCEYPANTYPWMTQAIDRGVVCKIVKTRPDGSVPAEDFEDQITGNTKLIAVSWVQYSTGYMTDLRTLAYLAHSNNAFLVVDVIQGLGGLPISLADIGVDAAATGSQKWLLGPMGVGGLYISPNMLERLRLANAGALSANNAYAFEPLNLDLKPNAQRYEEGTPNVCGYIGLNAALELIEEFGIENMAENILAVNAYAAKKLEGRGYVIDSVMTHAHRSGILMFHHPQTPADEIAKALAENKINVVVRDGKVRFAPHFYTDESDIDRAIGALP